MKTLAAFAVLLVLPGCSLRPEAAVTEVTPGQAEITSTRSETRPKTHEMKLKIEPPEAKPAPAVRIVITPPPAPDKETPQ